MSDAWMSAAEDAIQRGLVIEINDQNQQDNLIPKMK